MYGRAGNLIVINGLVACGRSGLIKNLEEKFKTYSIPSAHSLAVKTSPEIYSSKEDFVAKQQYYVELDKKVALMASVALRDHKCVIMDCNYVASLAYDYALFKENKNMEVFKWIIDAYIDAIESLELVIPDLYVFLDVSNEMRKKRSETLPYFDESQRHFDEEFSKNAKYIHDEIMKLTNSLVINYEKEISPERIFAKIEACLRNKAYDYSLERKKIVNFLKSLA
ncbi:MAG: thymidylate kinase [Alphaproteobacteria bacterium ADurb.Bin438]|nr:MAG: thymidylate kinase [Alphaproteobacteria bacterium ADurb.Bin438]